MRNGLRPGAVGLAASLLCATMLAACQFERRQDGGTDNVAAAKPPSPSLPIVEPPLNRANLLLAVARAASAHSIGAENLEAQRQLNGKQFEVRLRFGCDGPGPDKGGYGWSLDPDGRTLRLRVVPTLSIDDELVRRVAGANVEAAEGFWLKRPWILAAACPSGQTAVSESEPPVGRGAAAQAPERDTGDRASTAAGSVAAMQRIGIAHFFSPQDSRAGRRINRPFEAVKQLKAGEAPGQDGFNLILSGRLRARADGRVITCLGSGRDRPPDCIVSADVDRVWIERPESREVIAEWTV